MSLDPSPTSAGARPQAPLRIGEPSPGEAVAIIGLGYVGLPLAVALDRGQRSQAGGTGSVVGFDIDPRRIELLRQGRDHTGEVESDERFVTVTVADNGIGLPSQGAERILEPYVTTRDKGTGLGLAIVKKIVEEHAGEMGFKANTGGGTRVTLRFARDPLAVAGAEAAE